MIRLFFLLWLWPTFVGAALLGLSFLVAFCIRDIGLAESRSTAKSLNNNFEAQEFRTGIRDGQKR